MKTVRHRPWLIALLVVIMGVLVGLTCLVWPRPALNLRLKFVRTGIEDGKTVVLFRVEGAEQYELHVKSLRYLLRGKPASGLPSFNLYLATREFWATAAPEYYADLGDQGWQIQASVFVVVPEKNNIGKVFRVLKHTWGEYRYWRRGPPSANPYPSFLSLAKRRWNANGNYLIEQIITSDVITNTPPQ